MDANTQVSLPQVQSPVDSATLSPVERTAAWVFNNGQYEDTKKDTTQNLDEVKHAEKVDLILSAVHPIAISEGLSGPAVTASHILTQVILVTVITNSVNKVNQGC